ncbi:hypothetical protein OAP23_00430 [Flavobacteriaceae bacterium]|nr:hypothetical protein [Flavobacteriaceae bacterium]MDC0654425.1 hypothetical protein [Flavobacteriaceae bacterium]
MKYIYTLLLSFFIIGCSNNSEPIDQFAELSDLELIELIKSAEDKQEISINDMPDISQSFISETFNFAIVQSVFHAPNLGYELTMSRGGTRTLMSLSSLINVYFNNDGEFLSNDFDSEYEEWDQNMCFDLEFPISVNLSDGTVVTISNEEELYEGIEEYYEMGEEDNLPEINFPINIIFYYENENGVESEDLVEISNYEELEMYFEMCEDDEDINDDEENWSEFNCVALVYPITIESPEGENLSFENEDSLNNYIESWYNNNPNSNQVFELVFVFPLTVGYFSETTDQLQTLIIYSEEELGEFLEEYCIDDQDDNGEDDNGNDTDFGDGEDIFYDHTCGEVVFPISIEDPNGVVFNSDNEESLLEYLEQWFVDNDCNNVDCDDEFEIVYPISINYVSGNDLITMTIQSEEMLEEINGQYCDD